MRTNDFIFLKKGNVNFKYASSYKERVIVLQSKAGDAVQCVLHA